MIGVTIVNVRPHIGITESDGAVNYSSVIYAQEWKLQGDKLSTVRLTLCNRETILVRGIVSDWVASDSVI